MQIGFIAGFARQRAPTRGLAVSCARRLRAERGPTPCVPVTSIGSTLTLPAVDHAAVGHLPQLDLHQARQASGDPPPDLDDDVLGGRVLEEVVEIAVVPGPESRVHRRAT